MPVVRPRQRVVNDENSSAPLTRAKRAATSNSAEDASMPTKGALQPKRSVANVAGVGARKRAALGDVSNVNKTDAAEGKKPLAGKVGLVSKAAQPTGIQKSTARPTSRTALATKESRKTEVKRAAGAGAIGGGVKRKPTATKTESQAEPSEPATKRQLSSKPAQSVEPEAKPAIDPELENIDQEDLDDPFMVAEYVVEIFDYLRELEIKSIPNHHYMDHQDDIEWKTRGILIDWLIEVHTRFHLLPETLFLAVNIVDRFLSAKVVQLDTFQLVGITALFIASKYEEVLSPHVENFKRITDNGFSEAEILSAERFVLGALQFDLSYPNPMNFLRRVSKADDYDIQSRTIGKYLMEVSLLDHRFLSFAPSHVAAAAMYLARLLLDRGPWDKTLAYFAGYSEEQVEPVVHLMVDYLARPVVHEAFFKKYASKKFLKASIISRQWAKKNAPLFGIVDTDLTIYDLEEEEF